MITWLWRFYNDDFGDDDDDDDDDDWKPRKHKPCHSQLHPVFWSPAKGSILSIGPMKSSSTINLLECAIPPPPPLRVTKNPDGNISGNKRSPLVNSTKISGVFLGFWWFFCISKASNVLMSNVQYFCGLSARRVRRTKSRGPKGLQLKSGPGGAQDF